MNANRRSTPFLAAAALAALTSACSMPRVVPSPAPVPAPRPTRPAPAPAPAPLPPPPSAGVDWRQAPITPGNWTWGIEAGQSVARFGGDTLILRCDRAAGTLTLSRTAAAKGPEPMTVTTTSGRRTLSAAPLGSAALGVTLPARDSLFDAMAFSRGRFAVEVTGAAPLYVPSWPELSRVIEDCR
jgi:hypothetical protein